MMSLRKRIAALVLALLLPPVAVYLIRGLRAGALVNLLIFIAAQAVYWGFAALPGVALWALAILHGLVVALLLRTR